MHCRPMTPLRHARISLVGLIAVHFLPALATSTDGGEIKVEVRVPREAEVGSAVVLRCDWRILGGNSLNSVKWYKDEHEFFRYMPDNDPAIQTFSQPGVDLDGTCNSEKSIRLRNLTLASSGLYKCEVSTEAPAFHINFETAKLTVIALPERAPEITGLSGHYAVGENVTATCEAWPSLPKAKLRWTINDQEVPAEDTVRHGPLKPLGSGMPSMLGVRFEAEPRHFDAGLLRLKCIAEVASRTFVVERKVSLAHVNNQRLSAGDLMRSSGSDSAYHSTNPLHVLLLALLFIHPVRPGT